MTDLVMNHEDYGRFVRLAGEADALGSIASLPTIDLRWILRARAVSGARGHDTVHAVLDPNSAPLDERPVPCLTCGAKVEHGREVYVMPTCHACLPPPIPVIQLDLRLSLNRI